MIKNIGSQTLQFEQEPRISSYGVMVGQKEKEGPLGKYFESYDDDPYFGQDTWEKAEAQLVKKAVQKTLLKANMQSNELDYIFAGDLLNQCTSTSFAVKNQNVPYIGVYGACSTMALSMGLAAVFTESGASRRAIAATSSHFCSAERQFRQPLEYGGQRPPTSQWTVTGSGAVLVESQQIQQDNMQKPKHLVVMKQASFGKIEDFGITDVNNMGAAMAPAAASLLRAFFKDTDTQSSDYDLVITGDLGVTGSDLLMQLMEKEEMPLQNHVDCGKLIFDVDTQDVHCGGSGCGCSASVLCGYFLPKMERGELGDVLFVATGALMSPTTVQQGETIPCVAHLIHLSTK